MLVKTKHFGEIELEDSKIITFDEGLIGFEDKKRYTILFNNESKSKTKGTISWLQSLDEPQLALPVVSPFVAMADYNPIVEDEVLAPLGELNDENLVILLTLTVPSDLTKMTVNLKAPIIINADTRKGCQAIAENPDYVVRYGIYKDLKEIKGE